MRRLSLLLVCGLLAIAACGDSSSNEISDPEIRGQEDVQQLFETIMPDLIAALAEFANSLTPPAAVSPAAKQGDSTTIPCPQGGSITITLISLPMGEATLAACIVRGVTISGTLVLTVQQVGPSSYQASFTGPLTVTGTFTGMVNVISSQILFTIPPSEETTSWSVTVEVPALGQTFTATSGTPTGGSERCQQACNLILEACMMPENCVEDCLDDLAVCPSQMGAVLDCVFENQNQLQCDPEQDNGLAEPPCQAQHDAVAACDKDPF